MDIKNLSVTGIINSYRVFNKDFWLDYKTLEKLMDTEEFKSIKMMLLKSKRVSEEFIDLVDKLQFQIERALLDKEWTDKNEKAKQQGTEIHLHIHSLLTAKSCDLRLFELNPDLVVSEEFLTSDNGIFTELRLEYNLDPEYKLVGVPDCICIKDKSVEIIDWKTSEDGIKFKSMYDVSKKTSKRMKYPLSALDDVNGIHYNLLLSIYAWMIEKIRPDLKIEKLKIALIKNFKVHKTFEVPYLKDDVDRLIEFHLSSVKINREMEKCNLILY